MYEATKRFYNCDNSVFISLYRTKDKNCQFFSILLNNVNRLFYQPSINRLGVSAILNTIALNLIDPQYDPTAFITRAFFF